jgi:hypothetical protein
MVKCKICKSEPVEILEDFGPQPLCNRFVVDPKDREFGHPLVLGQCEVCGLVQLTDPVPSDEIVPRFEWLKYNEPEEHLDDLAEVLCNLEGLPENPVACGLTYKDDSLLDRLNKNTYKNVWRIDPKVDLNIAAKGVAGETIIPKLTPQSVRELARRKGRVSLIVARHVLEHAQDALGFLNSIKYLLEPGGYVAFEVPDCTSQLEKCDYSMMWEEHILYFVPQTLTSAFDHTSFKVSHYKNYPLPIENAMVAVVSEDTREADWAEAQAPMSQLLEVGATFAGNFAPQRKSLRTWLSNYRSRDGKIAVFGAGHLSSMFINLMGIANCLDLVVDDDPNKQALYMPGSKLPIRGAGALVGEDIGLCLLIMSAESELKVITKNKDFVERGGVFVSVFPNRENSIHIDT